MKDQLSNIDRKENKAYYHLPGLFEFYELYRVFLPLYQSHREYFYDWCEIGSIYGSPADCTWGGGRIEVGEASAREVLALVNQYGISPRLTFSNSLLSEEQLADAKCNAVCESFAKEAEAETGVIIYSDLLLNYLQEKYPSFYFVSSTTKVITDFSELIGELDREAFRYVVPDFRLNKELEKFALLSEAQRKKVELLCNECCDVACKQRKECYEAVSKINLGIDDSEHSCTSPDAAGGYQFSKAMNSPAFIGIQDMKEKYLPMGIQHFKIEGRGLGSALILEFILYYMTKAEYQIHVREALYLDNMLDLF